MSALRQPDFDSDYYYAQPEANPAVDRPQIARPQVRKGKVIKSKNFRANTLPKNLKTLSQIQKGSFAIAIATMTSSICLYASTVNIPKLWSQEYRHLEDLQLQERQLVAINETIKYQIAQEASQDSSLGISTPESAIFIRPARTKSHQLKDDNPAQDKIVEFKHNSWGY